MLLLATQLIKLSGEKQHINSVISGKNYKRYKPGFQLKNTLSYIQHSGYSCINTH
ncbi:asr1275 [Nostoc sp. PCC 7120 = FACHB-418]|nr:asr1275 [Nostoc sp. PCC 7120 = FACHB-418]